MFWENMHFSFPTVEVFPEDGGSMFLWKVNNDQPYYTASIPEDSNLSSHYHRNFKFKYSLLSVQYCAFQFCHYRGRSEESAEF
jgi:hypothetical protein